MFIFTLLSFYFQCLILAGDTNQEICDVTKREYNKMLQILSNIKQSSQLDKITTELEYLVSQLAKKGVVIDASTLKEALYDLLFQILCIHKENPLYFCSNFSKNQVTLTRCSGVNSWKWKFMIEKYFACLQMFISTEQFNCNYYIMQNI